MSLHLIDKEGKMFEVKSGERAPEGSSVDLEWYKAHGYVSAEEFFAKMRKKYDYDSTVITSR